MYSTTVNISLTTNMSYIGAVSDVHHIMYHNMNNNVSRLQLTYLRISRIIMNRLCLPEIMITSLNNSRSNAVKTLMTVRYCNDNILRCTRTLRLLDKSRIRVTLSTVCRRRQYIIIRPLRAARMRHKIHINVRTQIL